jgi:hypothetical protein
MTVSVAGLRTLVPDSAAGLPSRSSICGGRRRRNGRTQVIAEARTLDAVNTCFDDVLNSRVPARLVFELWPRRVLDGRVS